MGRGPGAGIGISPEKTMATAPVARAYQGDRRRQAVAARASSSGTAHTQWCRQETGETRRPVIPPQAAPAILWPRWWAQAATAIPAAPVANAAASHQLPAAP